MFPVEVGLLLALTLASGTAAEPRSRGLLYLQAQQGTDGSFGGRTGETPLLATAEALLALRSAGLRDSPPARSAEIYLASAAPASEAELELRRALALRDTVYDSGPSGGETHGLVFEAPDALHLSLSLVQSLPGPAAAASTRRLLSLAGPEGCLGVTGGDTWAELTAEAMLALRQVSYNLQALAALNQAAACLSRLQRPNGSFGTAAATAAAVLALSRAPGDSSAQLAAARHFLVSAQQPNGSWEGSVRVTARVLRALAASTPDWHVKTDSEGRPLLALEPAQPLQSSPVRASLVVENQAEAPAEPVEVRFSALPLAGGPEVVLARVSLPALAPFQSTTLSAILDTSGLSGRYTVSARVDPDALNPEAEERNNQAQAPLQVRVEQDLVLSASSLHFTEGASGLVRVDVQVRNLGASLPMSVPVHLYKGAPTSGGVLLGRATVAAGLRSNQVATVSFDWQPPASSGPVPLYAVVDPEGLLTEVDKSNNQAFRFYTSGLGRAVDLFVKGVSTPRTPSPGQPFPLSVTVGNASSVEATQVTVAAFQQGRRVAWLQLPFIPARGERTAELSLVAQGPVSFLLVVDPEQHLVDSNRANNSQTWATSSLTAPQRELSLLSLWAEPPSAQRGTPVRLSVALSNPGLTHMQTRVRLVDRVDNSRWALAEVLLEPGAQQYLRLGPFNAPAHAAVLEACIDPEGLVEEFNENDNCQELTLGESTSQLSLQAREMRFEPPGAEVGEAVHATVSVRNASALLARGTVQWWLGHPLGARSRLLGHTPFQAAASTATPVSFDFIRPAGAMEVYARLTQVSPANRNPGGDTLAGRHLFLSSLVDVGLFNSYGGAREVRVGQLTGRPLPELVLGHEGVEGVGSASQPVTRVSVLEPDGAGGYQLLWSHVTLRLLLDVLLVDAEADGHPEVLVASSDLVDNTTRTRLTALSAEGAVRWQQEFIEPGFCRVNLSGSGSQESLGLGDVDGDGVVDLVHAGHELRVYSAGDGHLLWSIPLARCGRQQVTVLDVEGDGRSEIFGSVGLEYFLADHTGRLRWRRSVGSEGHVHAIVDADGNGRPEFVIPRHRSPLELYEVATGQRVQLSDPFRSLEQAFSAGALRQDGLTYLALSQNNYHGATSAFSPELRQVWYQPLVDPGGSADVFVTSLADLRGLGRPQLLSVSHGRPPFLQDGRTGELIDSLPQQMAGGSGLIYLQPHPPVVVDLDADGHAEVIAPYHSVAGSAGNGGHAPWYGRGEALIFASPHWQRHPSVWPTRTLVQGRIGEDLRMRTGYRWWTDHNTWNQQFNQQPARLLPDLVVEASGLRATPAQGTAGEPLVLTARVRNAGGLPASGVRVAFYRGDPAAGGRLLGESSLAGSLAPRTGEGSVSLTWEAFPEGEHLIHAVANAHGTLEESGRENNTASMRVYVGQGQRLCDLALDSSSLLVSPEAPTGGERVSLRVRVHNVGARGCPATRLTLREGPGIVSSTRLGEAEVPALAAGEDYPLTMNFTALAGRQLYRLRLDEAQVLADADRGNNEVLLPLDAVPAGKQDLQVVGVEPLPLPAWPGEPVTVAVTVRSRGAPTPATSLLLLQEGAHMAEAPVPPLLAGETATLSLALVAPASSSLLGVVVDPENALEEFDEGNNTGSALLEVAEPRLRLSAEASPPVAGANTALHFTLRLESASGVGGELYMDAGVYGPTGELVASLASSRRVVAGAGGTSLSLPWNTGATPPGSYVLRVLVRQAGRQVATTQAPLAVMRHVAAASQLVADRGTYAPGESVLLLHRTANMSGNTPLAGATLNIHFMDKAGRVLASTQRALPTLPPGGFLDTTESWRVPLRLMPGEYLGLAELRESSHTLLASSQARWSVAGGATRAPTTCMLEDIRTPWGAMLCLRGTVMDANLGTPVGEDVHGEVRYFINDQPVGHPLSYRVALAPGSHTLRMEYPGNTEYAPCKDTASLVVSVWQDISSLEGCHAKALHQAVVLPDGKVLAVGGYNTKVDVYDPATGNWSTTGSLSRARRYHTATLLDNGLVLVAGGAEGRADATAELYDSTTGTWRPTGRMSVARRYHTATRLTDGRVLVAGGEGRAAATAEIYDPITGTWTLTGPMSLSRYQHTATQLLSGSVLVVGGVDAQGRLLSSAELYEPTTRSWRSVGSMGTSRSYHTATRLKDGRVLVAGGAGDSTRNASAELYDPATDRWGPTGPMAQPRRYHTATLLPMGQVLLTGGYDGSTGIHTSTELYNPVIGTWTEVALMNTERYHHAVALLLDGRVLVIGGFSNGDQGSAELL
jgi:subtilase family serine protease